MIRFNPLCRGILPLLWQQLRPWVPEASTCFPQREQLWGEHKGAPKWRPTAVRMDSLLNLRPRAVRGGAVSQAPDSFCWVARRRALAAGLAEERDSSKANWPSTKGVSQAFCLIAELPEGDSTTPSAKLFQCWMAERVDSDGHTGSNWIGRMARERDALPAVEAKKAEGASKTAPLMPKPPELMGVRLGAIPDRID